MTISKFQHQFWVMITIFLLIANSGLQYSHCYNGLGLLCIINVLTCCYKHVLMVMISEPVVIIITLYLNFSLTSSFSLLLLLLLLLTISIIYFWSNFDLVFLLIFKGSTPRMPPPAPPRPEEKKDEKGGLIGYFVVDILPNYIWLRLLL